MDNANEIKETVKSGPDKTVKLPNFPDEYTSPHWIWPPLTGYDILKNLLRYALRPRPRKEGMWVISVQDEWRCFSKLQWHYTDIEQAREAFRAQMRLHLQGSPILSRQRCIAVAQGRNNMWYLWQIVHEEPSLATHTATALQTTELTTLATALLKWMAYYLSIYQQCCQYPVELDLSLENIGVYTNQAFVYLGPIEPLKTRKTEIHAETDEMKKQAIKQVFTMPILQNLSVQVDLLQATLKDISITEPEIVLASLTELLSDIEG